MRIALGQLWQETNTLNPVPTTREDFEHFGVYRGRKFLEQMAESNDPGGFIQTLRGWPESPELVGLVRLAAWPSGSLTAATFEWCCYEMMTALTRATSLDGVLLALHGAMAAEGHPDVEGEVLQAVREVVGPNVPIVATLDLHVNLTQPMIDAADALVLYHTMPHIDIYETGQRAARIMRSILIDGVRPTTGYVRIPAVIPAERANTQADSGVAAEMKQLVQAIEHRPGVLTAGLATVQPWLDVPGLSSAAVVTTDGNADLARSCCTELAETFWQRRREFLPELHTAAEAVDLARRVAGGLVVLSDAADATTSGSPGDSVWILRELMRHRWRAPCLVTIVAPDLVERAGEAGVGARIDATVGGVRDSRFGTSVEMQLTVERLFDARFSMTGHIGRNMAIDMGRSAVLRQGEIFLIVTSNSGPHFAPELFETAGYDPFDAAVLVAKSPCGFRAVYESQASAIFNVKAPGCAPSDFWTYNFQQITRPLWPWDEIDSWSASPSIKRAQQGSS